MSDAGIIGLAVLQHADSMFPSGAVSFSWGLEALCSRGMITGRDDLRDFMTAQIEGRWADIDRPMIWHAYHAERDVDRICYLDALIEAQTLSVEQRLGSKRMGGAMLAVHTRLGTPMAVDLGEIVRAGGAYGHLPVMQGVLWRQLGLSAENALVMSAHGLCVGMLGAAIRLSVVGHMDAQKIHTQLLELIEHVLCRPLCEAEAAHSFIPQIEIASMNHETDEMRLFVN